MSNMWMMDIGSIEQLMEDPNYGAKWEPVECKGTIPGNISHHTSAVFGSTVVIYGGINDYDNNPDAFEFDSSKNAWSKMKQTGDVPKSRDDHSMSQIDDKSFVIFGGFVEGSRVNECFVCTKNGHTLEWKQIGANSPTAPCIRASHSSVVYQGKVYIFGGQDDDNCKLSDLWELDLATEVYCQIELPADSFKPQGRSGHSANIWNNQMFIFGGILELTKELNEMVCFDFATKKFNCIGSSQDFAEAIQMSAAHGAETESPGLKLNKQMTMAKDSSPSKIGKFGASNKSPNKSPTKLTTKLRRPGKSPQKKKEGAAEEDKKKETGLASPTSISMQNSFIIQNADESFDAYYTQMRKRKLGGLGTNSMENPGMGQSSAMKGASPGHPRESNYGCVPGIQPAARDGHSSDICESMGLLFIFGGDRHHMPFNDLYVMKL